jgi:hypothetical protein
MNTEGDSWTGSIMILSISLLILKIKRNDFKEFLCSQFSIDKDTSEKYLTGIEFGLIISIILLSASLVLKANEIRKDKTFGEFPTIKTLSKILFYLGIAEIVLEFGDMFLTFYHK